MVDHGDYDDDDDDQSLFSPRAWIPSWILFIIMEEEVGKENTIPFCL